jgi:hypothetical protein
MPNGTVNVNDSGPKAVDCEAIVRDDGSIVEQQRVAGIADAALQARRQAEAILLAAMNTDANASLRRHNDRGSSMDRRGNIGRGTR